MALPTDSKERKKIPLATGVLDYFPDALAAVAVTSRVGNEQHNPGQPLHWAREKSDDHPNTLLRHLSERGTLDTDGVRHSAKVAWRALAILQLEIEADAERERDAELSPKARDMLSTLRKTRADAERAPASHLDRLEKFNLRETLRMVIGERDAVRAELDTARRARDEIGTRLDKALAELDSVRAERDAARRARDEMGTRLVAASRESVALRDARDAVLNEYERKRREVSAARAELSQAKANARTASTERDVARGARDEMGARLLEASRERDALRDARDAALNEYDRKRHETSLLRRKLIRQRDAALALAKSYLNDRDAARAEELIR